MDYSQIKTKQNIFVSKDYLKRFIRNNTKPEWVSFCEKLIDENYSVILYLPENITSIYVTVVKHNKKQVVRISHHCPSVSRFLDADINYYLGPKQLGMLSEEEVLDVFRIYFR